MTIFISLITGLLAGAIAVGVSILGLREKYSLAAFAIAGGVSFALMFLVILLLMPTFAHWSDSGYVTAFYLIVICGFGVGFIMSFEDEPYDYSYRSRRDSYTRSFRSLSILTALSFMLAHGTLSFVGKGPNPCSVEETRAVVEKLLNFEAVNALEDSQESSAEKISDERSLQLARNQQPQNLQLGEYMIVASGYEQVINGRPMNVHPLTPKDYAAYSRYNQMTPGFLVVDSTRTDGYAQWIAMPKDRQIRYVSEEAPWGYDLERHVYFNYALPKGVRIEDITGPEVDDDMGFHYVGTIMTPSEIGGARFYMPSGVILVDPTTGEIQDYTLEEASKELPWLDRILPTNAATVLVQAYANYQQGAAVCSIFTSAGQWEIDDEPLITTRDGEQLIQYQLTTLNDEDPLVQEIVYVSPKSMKAYRFPGNGMLWIPKTSLMVRNKANLGVSGNAQPIEPKEPTIMWFGGQQFTVYVLERGTSFFGFGAIRSDLSRKENEEYILIASSLGQLSRRAIEQIAKIAPGSLDNETANSSFELRTNGIVDFIGTPYMESGDMKVIFTVKASENGQTVLYHFRASSRVLAEALVGVGHEVTITAQAVSKDPSILAEVSIITNESYPPR